ncbi:MAG: universal stress protein [Pararhodobacter sp.]|nr:universal stress protein [Pararhodobacter sp.]
MFSKILLPVDLAHVERLQKALDVAADMAAHHGATIICLGVTESTPGPIARTPAEYTAKLDAFAADLGRKHGIAVQGISLVSTDPAAEINKLILKAVRDTGADLVVMASHMPILLDHVLPSHGGYVAEHAGISVMVVR